MYSQSRSWTRSGNMLERGNISTYSDIFRVSPTYWLWLIWHILTVGRKQGRGSPVSVLPQFALPPEYTRQCMFSTCCIRDGGNSPDSVVSDTGDHRPDGLACKHLFYNFRLLVICCSDDESDVFKFRSQTRYFMLQVITDHRGRLLSVGQKITGLWLEVRLTSPFLFFLTDFLCFFGVSKVFIPTYYYINILLYYL